LGTDKGTILKQAQLFTTRGQYDKAIAEWQKLITGTHADAIVHNTIGDLQTKRNSPPEAIEAYLQGAAAYKACGDPLKAIAVYRKILKLDPNRLAVYQQVADLNAERGLVSSAIGDYTTLCKLLQKAGRTRDVLQVYRKMAQIDSGNVELKQRIAEMCVQEAMPAEAVEAFLALGKEYQNQHRRDEAQRAYEAARKIDPNNAKVEKAFKALDKPSLASDSADTPQSGSSSLKGEGAGRRAMLEAANHQIQSGEYPDAEAALMDMLSREPGDPEVCRLLARLHLRRGELSVAMGEFQFLAGAAMRAEEYALAESMLMEYLEAEPRCALLIESLAQVYEHKGDVAGAVARYSEALALLLERPDPDQPTLPEDLLGKLKELAPGSEQVTRFAKALKGSPPSSVVGDLPGSPQVQAAREEVETGQPESVERETVVAQTEGVQLDVMSEPLRQVQEPSVTDFNDPTATAIETVPPVMPPSGVDAGATELASSVVESSREPQSVEPEPPIAGPAYAESPVVEEPPKIETAPAVAEVAEQRPVSDAVPAEPLAEEPILAVVSQGMSEDEARVRYELGVAYKDMGLFDEAFEEFRQTIAVKALFLNSCCMMADCFKEQGAAQAAIMHYEQALTAARDDHERASEIRYELGLLYEAEGLVENAVQAWSSVGSYRDASERLERIKAAHGSEPGNGEDPVLSASGKDSESARRAKKRRVSYL
jgi:tetratricopeptide (TPR) repeat protein